MPNVFKMKPLQDRVIVKRTDPAEKTEGGLFIPVSAQNPTYEGTVVAVGEGKELKDGTIRPLAVKVGDKIQFEVYSGILIKLDGQEYTILREDAVIGILE